jgi:aminopeptidase N
LDAYGLRIKAHSSICVSGCFTNPDGKDRDKPIEIWTQGETEANSVWFPTIDKPNQKTTSEIAITVDEKYVTLSKGKFKRKQGQHQRKTILFKLK